MSNSHGLFFVAVAFLWGSLHGLIFYRLAFWKRSGLYVRNDEYRVGFFALSVVISLFVFRSVETYIVFGRLLIEAGWILNWAVVYCWGITWGFSRGVGTKKIDSMTNAQVVGRDSAFTPLTGKSDE